jgi:hypothetical protein
MYSRSKTRSFINFWTGEKRGISWPWDMQPLAIDILLKSNYIQQSTLQEEISPLILILPLGIVHDRRHQPRTLYHQQQGSTVSTLAVLKKVEEFLLDP